MGTIAMPTGGLSPEEARRIMRSAIKEWMDEQLILVGKWTLKGILVMAFGGAVYLALTDLGWHRGP